MSRSMDTAPRNGTWREPKTAPRDGSWFLARLVHDRPPVVIRWNTIAAIWDTDGCGPWGTGDLAGWLPLPSGDGWTRIADGEPEDGADVCLALRYDDGERVVRWGRWFNRPDTGPFIHGPGGSIGIRNVTHWQYVRLPALPEDGA